MYVLGIETSCDETAASVVKDGRTILSNIVASSLKEHQKYGGVIPEIASRRQMELINTVVQSSLEKAQLPLKSIHAIAVTKSPGLIGSLLVGISYARALSFATKKPLIETDHVKAHIYANFLRSKNQINNSKPKHSPIPKLPAIGLVVSGGHTNLYLIKSLKNFKLLGQTRDDAVGEAYDKVARILNLGYPGGPVIDQLAKQGKNNEIRFTCADLPKSYDFSFSGIKTAVLYYKNKHAQHKRIAAAKVSYAFQNSVNNVLVKKTLAACLNNKARTLLIGGGVAANSDLRTKFNMEAEKHNIQVHFPPIPLCMDNAAMIAGYGYHLLKN